MLVKEATKFGIGSAVIGQKYPQRPITTIKRIGLWGFLSLRSVRPEVRVVPIRLPDLDGNLAYLLNADLTHLGCWWYMVGGVGYLGIFPSHPWYHQNTLKILSVISMLECLQWYVVGLCRSIANYTALSSEFWNTFHGHCICKKLNKNVYT